MKNKTCPAEKDVPYTVSGNVIWRREQCGCPAMAGSKFCRWHHRPDYTVAALAEEWQKKADSCEKEIKNAAKSNGRKWLSSERMQHYEQAAITLRLCADELMNALPNTADMSKKNKKKVTKIEENEAAIRSMFFVLETNDTKIVGNTPHAFEEVTGPFQTKELAEEWLKASSGDTWLSSCGCLRTGEPESWGSTYIIVEAVRVVKPIPPESVVVGLEDVQYSGKLNVDI